ncbi:hypothetical protein [Faunimonas pinastri]|uniref:hypothetical protein n=1 Tax=Faunimonas pinastri TaxID=1855383 RepID=UPI000B80C501|nr:hypothetical protein [Faunimonas pinastri]
MSKVEIDVHHLATLRRVAEIFAEGAPSEEQRTIQAALEAAREALRPFENAGQVPVSETDEEAQWVIGYAGQKLLIHRQFGPGGRWGGYYLEDNETLGSQEAEELARRFKFTLGGGKSPF